MTAKFGKNKNGYTRLPTVDPDTAESGGHKSKVAPRSLRPGLFYMFGERGRYAVEHSESEEIEMVEMKPKRQKHRRVRTPKSPKSPRTPKSKQPRVNTIVEPILPGDTVQRVALRYGCPDSEIRRVNNLYKDQDFFALKTVKIPIRDHSVLTETEELEKRRKTMTDEKGSHSSSTSDEMIRLGGPGTYYRSEEEDEAGVVKEYSCDADDEKGESDGPEYRDISIQSALKWKYSRHALLQKVDQDLQKVREDTEQRASSLREVALTVDSPTIHPILTKDSHEKRFLRLDWRIMVFGVFAVIILIVLVYLIYLAAAYAHREHKKEVNPLGQ